MKYTLCQKDSCEMNNVQSELFMKAVMLDSSDKTAVDMNIIKNKLHITESECPMGMKLLFRRVKAFNLPIQFTFGAVMCFDIFPNQAGGVIVMLIDILQNHENKIVTAKDIAEIYPYGFYSPMGLTDRVDSFDTKPIEYKEIY